MFRYLILTFFSFTILQADVSLLKTAYDNYTAGEKAETIAERKDHFNKALEAYTKLESTYNPKYGNGKLYYDIGNSYFQLEEYPYAALYYYRALKLMPRDERVKNNLNITLQKLSVSDQPNSVPFYQPLFYLNTLVSLPQRLQWFFNFGVILLALIVAYLMRSHPYLKRLIIFVGILWGLILLGLVYTRYLEPIEGVLVHSSALYRDAGEQYATVSDKPILSGNKVKVLEVLQNGEWLKIMTPSGELGYIPATTIRII